MAVHNDWWASGWDHVLPRESFPLTMLIGTASQPGFTGSLDDLLQEIFESHWDMIGGDLVDDPDLLCRGWSADTQWFTRSACCCLDLALANFSSPLRGCI
ncbi:DUF6042 family protein [Streptomyces niveus]